MEPKLVLPSEKYKESFLAALAEPETYDGGSRLDSERYSGDFDSFLKILEDEREGKNLPKDRVPQTVYWLVAGDTFIGRVGIRHVLNDNLFKIGGHIGYAIRPSEREKGYGSLILKLSLSLAKKLGIEKALVTCKQTNEASRKIIEKNGGVYENMMPNDQGGLSLRYWINTKNYECHVLTL